MARSASDQETVLKKVVERLISQVSDFNAATCFISVDPDPDLANDHNIWATVTLMDSNFGQGELEGGAENACFEYGGFSVNIFSRVKLDERGHKSELLANQSLGLLKRKRLVLKALTGHDPTINSDGDTTLTGHIHPLNAPRPEYDKKRGLGILTIHFSLDLDWDLS